MRSCNRGCSGKAISITYSDYSFVALVIPEKMRACLLSYCHLWHLRLFHVYILITNLMHWWYLFIKYEPPLHVSSLKCTSSGGYSCTHAAYGTVTLYESFWWPVGTQLEW